MKRKLLMVFVMLTLFFGLKNFNVLASGFNLKSIGSVDTSGRQISRWWYTNSNPTFIGEAGAGSEVSVSIDGSETSVTADSDGSWRYTSGSLDSGDHSIVLTNNGSNISFTLTIGSENVDWEAVNSGTGDVLPAAGVVLPTIVLSMGGLSLVLGARRMAKKA